MSPKSSKKGFENLPARAVCLPFMHYNIDQNLSNQTCLEKEKPQNKIYRNGLFNRAKKKTLFPNGGGQLFAGDLDCMSSNNKPQ